MELLKDSGLEDKALFIYDCSIDQTSNKYIRDFDYIDEFKEIEGFTDLEYAYKEHRLLGSKENPYYKGEECRQCSLYGICDGFHAD